MGTWGDAPWDGDMAADWFADVIETNRLAAEVEDTLNSDPVEHAEEIRAAAAILIMLGRVYVWPIDDLQRHLDLAIARMQEVLAVYQDAPELASAVTEELAVLKSRRANAHDGPLIAQPESWGDFWS